MSKLTTKSVHIFPFSKPRVNSPLDNVFYEQNTTNMIRQLSKAFFKTDSFVVAEDKLWLEFNLHGYYFKVDKAKLSTLMGDSLANVTAYIIVNDATTSTPEYLEGQDDINGDFTGVHFTRDILPSVTTEKTVYSLQLYDGSGNVLLPSNLTITAIDGKHS